MTYFLLYYRDVKMLFSKIHLPQWKTAMFKYLYLQVIRTIRFYFCFCFTCYILPHIEPAEVMELTFIVNLLIKRACMVFVYNAYVI